MPMPNEPVKTSAAFRVLRTVELWPSQTTDTLKTIMGVNTQTVSARLSDLVDLGLISYGEPGFVDRNGHKIVVATFVVTSRGENLLRRAKAVKILKAGMKSLTDVGMERAHDLAALKKAWRAKVSAEAQVALVFAMALDDLI